MPGLNSDRFELGQIVVTPGVLEEMRLTGENPFPYLQRHVSGDWGEVSAEDAEENELSVNEEFRIFSVYRLHNNTKIYVITAWDRSVTTLLLPDEY